RPRLVEVHRFIVQAGHPDQHGRVVGQGTKALFAGAQDPLDLPLRFELPMLILGALALGDVPPNRLILGDSAVLIEESACGPVLPAAVPAGSRLVLARRHWPTGRDRVQVPPDGLVTLRGKEVPETVADEILCRAVKTSTNRAVDERVRAIGKKPADQLRLIL